MSHNLAHQNYSNAQTRSVKDAEIDVILETTRRLRRANQMRAENFPNFASALRDNCKLWIVLAADVASTGNALPESLRARIFYLGEFTQEHTRKILSNKLSAEPLIDINLSVLRGLTNKKDSQ